MRKIKIEYPIWKTRSIGIAEYKITDDLLIEILYRDKSGQRLYPHKYRLLRSKALCYPKQVVKNGVILRIVPISELEIYHAKKKND